MQAGADVDLQDDTRRSAYLIATSEVGDGTGATALAHAERSGQRAVASILRAAGAAG